MGIWRTEIKVFEKVLESITLEPEDGDSATVAQLNETDVVEIPAPQLIEILKHAYDSGIDVGVRLTGRV